MIFNADQHKKISMVVETSNVNNDDLDFTFSVKVCGIKYGFPCKMVENKVSIDIPALNTIIKDLKEGDYAASLEVTGDGKYYLQPFNENITIKQTPKINVLIDDEDTDIKEGIEILVSTLIDDEDTDIDEKIIDIDEKSDSKLSEVFK